LEELRRANYSDQRAIDKALEEEMKAKRTNPPVRHSIAPEPMNIDDYSDSNETIEKQERFYPSRFSNTPIAVYYVEEVAKRKGGIVETKGCSSPSNVIRDVIESLPENGDVDQNGNGNESELSVRNVESSMINDISIENIEKATEDAFKVTNEESPIEGRIAETADKILTTSTTDIQNASSESLGEAIDKTLSSDVAISTNMESISTSMEDVDIASKSVNATVTSASDDITSNRLSTEVINTIVKVVTISPTKKDVDITNKTTNDTFSPSSSEEINGKTSTEHVDITIKSINNSKTSTDEELIINAVHMETSSSLTESDCIIDRSLTEKHNGSTTTMSSSVASQYSAEVIDNDAKMETILPSNVDVANVSAGKVIDVIVDTSPSSISDVASTESSTEVRNDGIQMGITLPSTENCDDCVNVTSRSSVNRSDDVRDQSIPKDSPNEISGRCDESAKLESSLKVSENQSVNVVSMGESVIVAESRPSENSINSKHVSSDMSELNMFSIEEDASHDGGIEKLIEKSLILEKSNNLLNVDLTHDSFTRDSLEKDDSLTSEHENVTLLSNQSMMITNCIDEVDESGESSNNMTISKSSVDENSSINNTALSTSQINITSKRDIFKLINFKDLSKSKWQVDPAACARAELFVVKLTRKMEEEEREMIEIVNDRSKLDEYLGRPKLVLKEAIVRKTTASIRKTDKNQPERVKAAPEYRKPKLYTKEPWITKHLYRFIQMKLEPKYV
jgi:hypothetical protein